LIGKSAGGALRQHSVQNVLPDRCAFFSLVFIGLALSQQIYGGAIQRGGDRTGKEGAVVARVVPCKAAFVAAILPERDRVLDRFDGGLAVKHHLLASLVDLRAAKRPQKGIPKGRWIAEAVTERLAERLALGLEPLACRAVLVPSFRKLGDANRFEPRF